MDFERLTEFVKIVENGQLKKTAEELHLSYATLNARMRAFEKSLNLTLFNRSAGKLTLSSEGQLFYHNAARIAFEYGKLKEELETMGNDSFSSLKIAVAGSGLPYYLGPYLDILNARHPNMQLDILDSGDCSITEGLLSGQVDVYFAPVMNPLRIDGIAHMLVSHNLPCALLPANHPLARKNSIALKELDGERFILYPKQKENCIRDFQLANLKAAGIHYSLYEHHTSVSFYELLVPIEKGLILSPAPFLHVPPNSVSVPVTDIVYPASSSLFYCRNNEKKEIKQFINGFTKFVKESSGHEHRKAL